MAFVSRIATISNRRGLHARAAAKFVKTVERYDAQVEVRLTPINASLACPRTGSFDQPVSGRSIMGLMMLAAGPGTEIELRAEGPQALAALAALGALIDAKFDEE